jgi:uncharacterized membrane protein YhaH (DUF805 family)
MNWYLAAIKKYAVFSGRARRSEYWYFVLFNFIGFILLLKVAELINNDGSFVVMSLFTIGLFLPGLAVAVRRLHDIGKSGWFLLIWFIPFGGIWLIVSLATEGVKGSNEYGPDPKNPDSGGSGNFSTVLDDNI